MKLIIPPPIYGLIIFDAMWWLNSLLPLLAVTFVDQKQLATLAIVTGLTIDVIAIISFIKTKTTINLRSPQNTHQLVTTGLYRFSRKPMYLVYFVYC